MCPLLCRHRLDRQAKSPASGPRTPLPPPNLGDIIVSTGGCVSERVAQLSRLPRGDGRYKVTTADLELSGSPTDLHYLLIANLSSGNRNRFTSQRQPSATCAHVEPVLLLQRSRGFLHHSCGDALHFAHSPVPDGWRHIRPCPNTGERHDPVCYMPVSSRLLNQFISSPASLQRQRPRASLPT